MKYRNSGILILVLSISAGIAFLGGRASGQLTVQPRIVAPTPRLVIPTIVQRSITLNSSNIHRMYESASIYRVPAGKRLKIEQISGHIEAVRNTTLPELLIRTTAGSVTVRHEINLGQPDMPLSTPGSHFYYFNTLTAIYADAGTEVLVELGRGSGGVDLNVFGLSGRLEPM